MYKPNSYDSAVPYSESKPPEGYYILKIIDAVEGRSKNNDAVIRFDLDIDEGEYKGFYTTLCNTFNRNLLLKCMQLWEKESAVPYFKKIIQSIEGSNPGYQFDFNPFTLAGKRVGAFLQNNIYEKDGQKRQGLRVTKFMTTDEIVKYRIADTQSVTQPTTTFTNNNSNDDSLPF